MLNIDVYDICTCGSGKKFKFCCRNEIKKPTRSFNWTVYPEKFVIGSIIRTNDTFREFYERDRSKIKHPLYWVEDNSLAEGIDHRVTTFYNKKKEVEYSLVRLREVPAVGKREAMMIAHELIHLLLDEEGFLGIAPRNKNYDYLASALSSALEDPVVNMRLTDLGFDVSLEYEFEVKETIRQLSTLKEPTDYPDRLLWIFNYASKLIDRKLSKSEDDFPNWFMERFPTIAHEGEKVFNTVMRIGIGTKEQKQLAMKEITEMYDREGKIFLHL